MRGGEAGREATEWMFRLHYREKFKLTAEQFDNEPAQEVAIYSMIWRLQQAKEELDHKREQQQKT